MGEKSSEGKRGSWVGVTRSHPCPICAKPDQCSISTDGKRCVCYRVGEAAIEKKGRDGRTYYVHRLTGDKVRPPIDIPATGAKVQLADSDTLHHVYDALLGALVLSQSHRDNLRKRGLTDEEIDRRLYRSLSVQGRASKARNLADRFGAETLLSVPGFIIKRKDNRKYITIVGSPGLLIPCRNLDGKVVALKVRRDEDGPEKKYLYISSSKKGGPGPGSPCHVPIGIVGPVDAVRITEGELKSDVAYSLSGIPTISFPGVGSWRVCLPALQQLQTKTVYIAFDADAADNAAVARPLAECYEALVAEGFSVCVERWDTAHKGIDDILAAGEKPELLEGDAARDFVSEAILEATAGEPPPPPSPLDRLASVLCDGAEELFADKELLEALAKLAESDPSEYACCRAKIKAGDISLRELDRAIAPFRQKVRAEKPPLTSSGLYRVSGGATIREMQTKEGPVDVPLANFSARIVSQTTVDDGAERSIRLEIEGTLADGTPLPKCEVPADKFSWMDWIIPSWGTRAVVNAGASTKDHLRCAVQLLSGDVAQRTVYAHLGWRKTGERWVYLHAGGAMGTAGPVDGVEVAPPGALERYVLPTPPNGEELCLAVRASLGLLDLGPARLMFPLLSAVYRTVLGPCDFSLHLLGQSGMFKSEVAALMQQHYGAGLDRPNLPCSWASTANSNEATAFGAKDALLVVDDFAPSGSANDVARLHREAERLLRAQGNSAGRGRMRRDGTLASAKPPRGLILSTGEDVPRGQSLRARLLILEAGKGDFGPSPPAPNPKLTACQHEAADGLYAASLAGFVRWLAPRYETIRDGLSDERAKLRDAAAGDGQHARTPNLVADLAIGLRHFLDFAVESGAIAKSERDELARRGWKALLEAGTAQQEHQRSTDPVETFLRLLSAAVASGRAHVAAVDGGKPGTAAAWGWRLEDAAGGPSWREQGRRVGWVDGDNLYLEPDAAYATVQGMAGEQGESITVTARTLWARLRERGILANWDAARQRNTIRVTLQGVRREILHIPSALLFNRPSQPSQPSRDTEIQPGNGTVCWDGPPPQQTPPSQQNVPFPGQKQTESGDAGRLGRLGRSAEQGSDPGGKIIQAADESAAWVAPDAAQAALETPFDVHDTPS